ncbi:MAG: asparagine synthase (glutamine-hydrolyzing) [Legionella sp.]|nr:asparagine synthase (glutamine-hydrolyzing) [Legionella sp.]
MCGIAGIIGAPPNKTSLKHMADAMVHRGPDDEQFYLGNQVGFAFRRLSIMDIQHGRQPMTNEDGTVWVVFNGEIYNHLELRQQLIQKGHRFATDHSDTEVLVHGWEEWGEQLFNKLNGMFAFGLWDANQETFILVRDRYGIKPVYYAETSQHALVFGSEIKAILASGLVDKMPSTSGIMEYFSFQNLWRDETMFKGIKQLEPATCLMWKNKKLTKTTYWDITFDRSSNRTLSDLTEQHRSILKDSVKRQLVADVPVTSYLSGGIDSTAITMAAHQLDPSVKAYSCIFDLKGVINGRHFDEREYSRQVAKHAGLDRVEFTIGQDALSHSLDDYVYALEDLRMGMGYVNYLIAGRVAEDAKVVLSGTGGDEFHAGYVGRYAALGLTKPVRPSMRMLLKKILRKEGINPAHMTDAQRKTVYKQILNPLFNPTQYHQVFTQDFMRSTGGFNASDIMDDFINRCPSNDWRDIMFYVDAKTYLVGLLTLEDKVSMAHSLETRLPLLDNELIDFVQKVPFSYLCKDNIGKILFRESVKPWVPQKIYKKPKMGFGPPDAAWYRGKLRLWIEQALQTKIIKKQGVFQPQYIQSVLDDHFSKRADNTYLIWSLLNFQAWCKAFEFF